MSAVWKAGRYILPLGHKTYVMGILNVTPDSFSDGGRYTDPGAALEHALQMQEEGADIIDLGGQSTRPGYEAIGAEEEWARLAPVMSRLCGALSVPVSVDTFYPLVAGRALSAGADVINDVTGFQDPAMFQLARESGCGCVVMHSGAGVDTIRPFFARRLQEAVQQGLDPAQLCFDPGIGFGKTYEENLAVLREMRGLLLPPYAMLVGASRKRVIGAPCGNPPFTKRLPGTLAAHTLAVAGGADVVRVHDVAEAVQAARVADAILREPADSRAEAVTSPAGGAQ
jgi:dihydropteroate synthase